MTSVQRHRFTDLNLLSLSLRLGNFTGDMLFWGFREPVYWRNYLHTHSFFEAYYVYQGQGTFCVNGAEHEVAVGDVFVDRPGDPHEIISSQSDPLGIYYWSYTLVPSSWRTDRLGVDGLLSTFIASPQHVGHGAAHLQAVFDLLTAEVAAREPGYTHVIEGLTNTLVIATARAITDVAVQPEQARPPAKSMAEALSQQIIKYLWDNYAQAISLRDVAAQVHLSERHTNRLFQQATEMSIMEYLTNIRMEVAAQLLIERRLSIKEVAQASGYPNVHYFTTLFHRRMGLAPAAFQRANGTRQLRTS